METALLIVDFLKEAGVPLVDIAYMAIGCAIVVLLWKQNKQTKKNGYLTTEEFHKFEDEHTEVHGEIKGEINDIKNRLTKVETVLDVVVKTLDELRKDVKELMRKVK